MNPLIVVFGVLGMGYFLSSVVRTQNESKIEDKQRFRRILAWLEERASARKGVTKQPNGMFLVWPRGHIDNVLYDGSFAAYVTPLDFTSSFKLQAYGYSKEKGWTAHEAKKNVYSAAEFEMQFRESVFLVSRGGYHRSEHSPHHPPHPHH